MRPSSPTVHFASMVERYLPARWRLVSVKRTPAGSFSVTVDVGESRHLTISWPSNADSARLRKDISEFEDLVARC